MNRPKGRRATPVEAKHYDPSSSSHRGELGAALWIALMFLFLVMILTVVGSRITVSMLRGEESREKSSEELWAARAVSADLEARLRYDLPTQFNQDVATAKQMPGATPGLGAFDWTAVTTSYPVAVVQNGQLVANPNLGSDPPTSLLGAAQAWAQARAAQTLTATVGGITGSANLAGLFELTRNPPYSLFLHYIVDAKAGFNRVRPYGDVQLLGQGGTPIQSSADLSISMSAPSSVQVGNNIVWTIPVTNGGPSTSTGSTVTVNLALSQGPWTGSYTLTGTSGECDLAPFGVLCTIGAVAPSSGYTIGIMQSVQSGGSTNSITANVQVVGKEYDPTTPDTATATATVTPAEPSCLPAGTVVGACSTDPRTGSVICTSCSTVEGQAQAQCCQGLYHLDYYGADFCRPGSIEYQVTCGP
ncbi:MAG TPA: hypothetical protein VNB49_19065 [Candidatus Dormibacteraeota bacterium]|nr:hypothetical protein [Candidatus Dormibacteraeota bacterium]